jgi:hypothetical protein
MTERNRVQYILTTNPNRVETLRALFAAAHEPVHEALLSKATENPHNIIHGELSFENEDKARAFINAAKDKEGILVAPVAAVSGVDGGGPQPQNPSP